jgi:A/G-specific adenine glycosylase
MNKNLEFSKILVLWYLNNKRDLPWRKTKDPYLIWLSEIILQQTKIAQGRTYYLKFKEKFNDIFSLALANEKEVLKLWQGLGYYSRAVNLHSTAKTISRKFNGRFPENYNELIQLKGIGDYTASAIASICFNIPEATVDGNVYRVLSRYFGVLIPINSSKGKKIFKDLAQLLVDPSKPGTHNQAVMEFGALICKPKKPDCVFCPLNNSCFALKKDKIQILPVKTNKIKIRNRFFNYLVINNKERSTSIQQRTKKDIWKNLFEFPLHESTKQINVKEFIETSIFKNFIKSNSYMITKFNDKQIVHKLTHQHLYTTFWIVDINEELEKEELWENLTNYALPTLIQNFVDKYRNGD